ncbi:MAG TPA: hypothetical protein VNX02_11155 [Steroidobacteraceae bacterium]|jgi:hypothetical protein|nr:hypothetical protein [Steroidobacteraceae bacterium]
MQQFDRAMPKVLRHLNGLYPRWDDAGMDFEPYSEFLSEEETRIWIRAWTGNTSLDGSQFLVFGQDGSGGRAMFWCVRPNASVLEQPITFFSSEGDVGVIAINFADYLWLLAGGYGPFEALAYSGPKTEAHEADPRFTAFATLNSGSKKKTPQEVLSKAGAEFPNFRDDMLSLCR